MSTNLYPIRHRDDGDIEVQLTADLWPLVAGSVLLFSSEVAPSPGNWVLVRGRLGEPVLRTWPQRGDRWIATATDVLRAPPPDEIKATRHWRLRAWGLPGLAQRSAPEEP